jgi:hypothetical protein
MDNYIEVNHDVKLELYSLSALTATHLLQRKSMEPVD